MNDENTTNIHKSIIDEMIKLYVLVSQDEMANFSGKYLIEKVGGAIRGHPIILHPCLMTSYKNLVSLIESNEPEEGDKITCKGVGNMPDGEYIVKSVTHEELK
jgi:hypothetical protein